MSRPIFTGGWLSGFGKKTSKGRIWIDPDVRAFNSADINVEYKFGRDGSTVGT